VVTGTNGKTTTAALVRAGWGGTVASNETGSNMLPGLVAALSASGAAHAVLEVDEAWLPTALPSVRPRVIVLTNLSRDQLDRANEVRAIAAKWRVALASSSAAVVANVNDPLVVYAASSSSQPVWVDVPVVWSADGASCPQCTAMLQIDGDSWHCDCGLARPTPTWALRDGVLTGARGEAALRLSIPGSYNLANAALAAVALHLVGEPIDRVAQRMAGMNGAAGRYSRRRLAGREFQLLLAKNPAGMAALLADPEAHEGDLAILINDNVADGLDPSWLYDAPFSLLRGRHVWCGGTRALDMAVRLDYDDIETVVVNDIDELPPTFTGAIIANYTAFYELLRRTEEC
jgi:UDP-N-acetylmuramyl tripeptide synthase